MTPEEFVSVTSDSFQNIGAQHYFGDNARAAAEALGIDLFRFYFAGRGGFVGDVSSEVLQSTFGYFNPAVLNKMWSTVKERCDISEAAQAQLNVAYGIAGEYFADIDGLETAAAAMAKLTSAVDVAALPLFASFLSAPVPKAPTHAFMHQTILFRELRGSIHLAAVAATGCSSKAAHQLRRPQDLEMFGYREEIAVTDAERAAYAQAEPLTDAAMVLHADQWLTSDERQNIAEVATAANNSLG